MIDPESDFRDAYRPIRIRSYAEVLADERREWRTDALWTAVGVVCAVGLLFVMCAAGGGR